MRITVDLDEPSALEVIKAYYNLAYLARLTGAEKPQIRISASGRGVHIKAHGFRLSDEDIEVIRRWLGDDEARIYFDRRRLLKPKQVLFTEKNGRRACVWCGDVWDIMPPGNLPRDLHLVHPPLFLPPNSPWGGLKVARMEVKVGQQSLHAYAYSIITILMHSPKERDIVILGRGKNVARAIVLAEMVRRDAKDLLGLELEYADVKVGSVKHPESGRLVATISIRLVVKS